MRPKSSLASHNCHFRYIWCGLMPIFMTGCGKISPKAGDAHVTRSARSAHKSKRPQRLLRPYAHLIDVALLRYAACIGHVIADALRAGLIILYHGARRIKVVTDRQAGARIIAWRGITFDTIIHDPVLATIRVISNGSTAIGQNAGVTTTVVARLRSQCPGFGYSAANAFDTPAKHQGRHQGCGWNETLGHICYHL